MGLGGRWVSIEIVQGRRLLGEEVMELIEKFVILSVQICIGVEGHLKKNFRAIVYIIEIYANSCTAFMTNISGDQNK
jgi:hypothetical protein